ncbi:MAG: hypothetical protein ACE3L7_28340 [Candidatus Pristimantibacillus sp.]
MNVFVMKLDRHENENNRIVEFLKDNFVCIGWSGTGDLENVSGDELRERLASVYPFEDQELADQLDEIHTFVNGMQDGDYLLAVNGDHIYLGDLGDYYYIDTFDNAEDGSCHRRGVTWLKTLLRADLNAEIQQIIDNQRLIVKLDRSFSIQELEAWLCNPLVTEPDRLNRLFVDADTIEKALDILRIALDSDDAERRERAAIAILQYAR